MKNRINSIQAAWRHSATVVRVVSSLAFRNSAEAAPRTLRAVMTASTASAASGFGDAFHWLSADRRG
jgi:hypothetical protein